MALLTKEQILGADDLPYEDVPVPEWGGDVRVQTMDGVTHNAFQESLANKGAGLKGVQTRLCALCLVDEAGARLFTDEDVEALGKKSGAALHRVFDVAMRLNALSKKDAEDLAKN